jgi:hypothetical protein
MRSESEIQNAMKHYDAACDRMIATAKRMANEGLDKIPLVKLLAASQFVNEHMSILNDMRPMMLYVMNKEIPSPEGKLTFLEFVDHVNGELDKMEGLLDGKNCDNTKATSKTSQTENRQDGRDARNGVDHGGSAGRNKAADDARPADGAAPASQR